ncbi:hypothetical protein [Prevotella sp. MGM2]|uniref:hypothetical protein n=1 Tax=Prevotella sp. MGM2 TaxID=2033406 RepID=UPI000CEA2018|nr:hypothetical protein [Prevotella sp. MGM2]GAY31061.1 hypothetical protein PvtlMGM2_1914 [Prevotella sp. MGM2]
MKFFNAIRNWLEGVKERYQAKRQERYAKQLEQMSCKSINVIEFNGCLFIAHDGVPIVRVDDLKAKAPEILAQAREDYLAWRAKFNA